MELELEVRGQGTANLSFKLSILFFLFPIFSQKIEEEVSMKSKVVVLQENYFICRLSSIPVVIKYL